MLAFMQCRSPRRSPFPVERRRRTFGELRVLAPGRKDQMDKDESMPRQAECGLEGRQHGQAAAP